MKHDDCDDPACEVCTEGGRHTLRSTLSRWCSHFPFSSSTLWSKKGVGGSDKWRSSHQQSALHAACTVCCRVRDNDAAPHRLQVCGA